VHAHSSRAAPQSGHAVDLFRIPSTSLRLMRQVEGMVCARDIMLLVGVFSAFLNRKVPPLDPCGQLRHRPLPYNKRYNKFSSHWIQQVQKSGIRERGRPMLVCNNGHGRSWARIRCHDHGKEIFCVLNIAGPLCTMCDNNARISKTMSTR
jgi:hypothetical protein